MEISDKWKDLKNGNIRQIERTETKEKDQTNGKI